MPSTRCTGKEKLVLNVADAVSDDPGRGIYVFDDNGSFLLAMFEFFIFVAWFMCLFWIFGDLFRSRDLGGGAKTLWALFLILLPILGTFIYLIVRGTGMTERALAAQAEAQKRQDAYIRSVAAPDGSRGNVTDEIASAKALLDSGAISATEYEQLKAAALSKTASPAA